MELEIRNGHHSKQMLLHFSTSHAWENFPLPTTSSSKNGFSPITAIILPEQISVQPIIPGGPGQSQKFYLMTGRMAATAISFTWIGTTRTAIMPLMQEENINGAVITALTSFLNMQPAPTAQLTQRFISR